MTSSVDDQQLESTRRIQLFTCSLDFPAGHGDLLADLCQLRSFLHNAVKHVGGKGVHDLHALL